MPLQPARIFGKNGDGWHNLLIFGDNLQVMKSLLEMKKAGKLCNADGTPGVRLVYIAPPFATMQHFEGIQQTKHATKTRGTLEHWQWYSAVAACRTPWRIRSPWRIRWLIRG